MVMENKTETRSPLEWREEYSVGVEGLDDQHRHMFGLINQLVGMVNSMPTPEQVASILNGLIEYKQKHFATEEGYFRRFGFEGAEEHIVEHRKFDVRIEEIREKYGNDRTMFVFELVDFLEDWLIDHILHTDRKYIECFHQNGLK